MSTPSSDAPRLLKAQPCDRTLKLRPWGGTALWRGRGLDHPERGQPLGESWEFSTFAGSESRCESQDLGDLLGHPLPFLVKLVDVARPLSVQVHPEGPLGKEEAWVVLAAEPNAQILAGLRPGVDTVDFQKAIAYAQAAQGRQDEVFECMQPHTVAAGSLVIIPPRTVHTIPSRVSIAEIQDPNDVTLRFFDYGSERELHLEEALANLDPKAQPKIWTPPPQLTREQMLGERVTLDAMGPGTHQLNWTRGERLLVAVQGAVTLRADHQCEALQAGELRLARGGPVHVEVQPGAMAVMAWL